MKPKNCIDLDFYVELITAEHKRIRKKIMTEARLSRREVRLYVKCEKQLDIIANTVRPITIW